MSVATIVATGPAELVRSHPVSVSLVLVDADDDAITPTSWTVALQRNGATVDTDTGTGAVSWSYTAAASLVLADDYLLVWEITVPGGSTLAYRQAASVCLSHLYPTVRPADLVSRYPRLASTAADPLLSDDADEVATILLDSLALSWRDCLDAIRQQGNRSHRIVSPWDVRAMLTERALQYVFGAVSTAYPAGDYETFVERHREAYGAALAALSIDYAPADGKTAARRSAHAPLFAGGAAGGVRYGYQRDLPQGGGY
jgi:hypothetical protein